MTITVDDVVARLKTLGYPPPDTERDAIEYAIGKTTAYVRTVCNIPQIPLELRYTVIDMICGDYLQTQAGSQWLAELGITPVIASISQGDTTTVFARGGGSASPFDALVERLVSDGREQLISFRRLRW